MNYSRRLMQIDAEFYPLALVSDSVDIGTTLNGWSDAGLTVRIVRGRKMRTLDRLFDEFAAALQFPLYFGENRDAFNECISDLDALPRMEGYVLTITEPDQVLADEADNFEWLVQSLGNANKEWSSPVELGEWWDRPAVPFHVVLVGEAGTIALAHEKWTRAGVRPMPLA